MKTRSDARGGATRRNASKRFGFDELPHGLGPAGAETEDNSNSTKHHTSVVKDSGSDGNEPRKEQESTASSLGLITTARQLRPRIKKEQPLEVLPGGGSVTTRKQTRLILRVTKKASGSNVAQPDKNKPVSTQKGSVQGIVKTKLESEEGSEVPEEVQEAIKEDELRRTKSSKKRSQTAKNQGNTKADEDDSDYANNTPERQRKKRKAEQVNKSGLAQYGIEWAQSPWPEWAHPTAAECEEVHTLLTDMHGTVTQPAQPPPPSFDRAGCGDVPHLLEALIRTRLSASTTMENANRAIQGLVAKYGKITKKVRLDCQTEETVIYQGIDWNKARRDPIEDLEKAIRTGGLGAMKSIDIKQMLDEVYEENRARRDAFMAEKTGKAHTEDIVGPKGKTQEEKDLEIWLFDNGILSLDHYHGLTAEAAVTEFIRFRGIGVKTAACVALFCMSLPCFAVDTHIFRICKWLRWAPPKCNRDQAFVHLDLHVPDHLKYALHQLFIRHGQDCKRCQEKTTAATPGWDEEACPLEHLLDRYDKQQKEQRRAEKAALQPPKKTKTPKPKGKNQKRKEEAAVASAEQTSPREDGIDTAEAILNPDFEGNLSMEEIASAVHTGNAEKRSNTGAQDENHNAAES